jgi:DNA-binding XRE family transcriptional regulator
MKNAFLTNLTVYLAENGKDRGWLAEVSGVNRNTINAMYANNRWPRLDVAVQIADAIDVPLMALVYGKDKMHQYTRDVSDIANMLKTLSDEDLAKAKSALQMWMIMHHQ